MTTVQKLMEQKNKQQDQLTLLHKILSIQPSVPKTSLMELNEKCPYCGKKKHPGGNNSCYVLEKNANKPPKWA